MFCAPLRSDMKYRPLPPAAHIGHASFAPPLRELFVTRAGPRGRGAHDPDLALVEMAVPLAPPLRRGVGAGGDRHRLAAGRRRREILRRVPVRRDRHRRAAVDADAVDVEHPGNLVAVRLKQHRLAVGRPAAHQLVRVVEREPRHVAAREREHVHVAVPRASGGEGEPLAVRREQRARFGGGMRHEQPRVAAARPALPRCRRRSRTRSWNRREKCPARRRTGERICRREVLVRQRRARAQSRRHDENSAAPAVTRQQSALCHARHLFLSSSSCKTPTRRACPCPGTARRAPSSPASARP